MCPGVIVGLAEGVLNSLLAKDKIITTAATVITCPLPMPNKTRLGKNSFLIEISHEVVAARYDAIPHHGQKSPKKIYATRHGRVIMSLSPISPEFHSYPCGH